MGWQPEPDCDVFIKIPPSEIDPSFMHVLGFFLEDNGERDYYISGRDYATGEILKRFPKVRIFDEAQGTPVFDGVRKRLLP